MCLGYAVFFGNIVLMPLWLQSYLGYTATWAGFVSAPSGVTAIITSIFVGRLMRRFDPRMLAASSFGFYALSYFMRARPHRGCELLRLHGAAAGAGICDGNVLRRHAGGDLRWTAPAEDPGGVGPFELPAHHGGQLRDLADHDVLGSARSAASDAACGCGERLRARVPAIARADAPVRPYRSGGGGRNDAGTRRAELPACPRSISSIYPRGCAWR